MAEFLDDDLEDARFIGTRLNMARVHDAQMERVKITGTSLANAEIWSNDITGMTINGVDVAPLVEAELDRRHPERRKLLAVDAAGVKDAWAEIEAEWDRTLSRALRLPPSQLFERTDELEWSFVEMTRHLSGRLEPERTPWDKRDHALPAVISSHRLTPGEVIGSRQRAGVR